MKTDLLDKVITSSILKRNPIYENVEGAPFKIGDIVIILDNPNSDDTFEKSFVHKIGEVFFFEYDCGCGQSFPNEPMIGIKFPEGAAEEFWKEELELLS